VTAADAGAFSSAMFNDRGRISTTGQAGSRQQVLASLYAQHAKRVQRLVARHAGGDVEDACQTAWERLLSHNEVDLQGRGVVNWLVITAARVAWKRAGQHRELPFEALRGEGGDAELIEPAGDAPDPLAVVLERDDTRRRLARLTARERQFLALQVLGLTYGEISQATGASWRTVERQVLRARRKLRPTNDD
jgi:RNA polymerase sigma factor (sigma-70 family)